MHQLTKHILIIQSYAKMFCKCSFYLINYQKLMRLEKNGGEALTDWRTEALKMRQKHCQIKFIEALPLQEL
jgi:hypothetical protein